MNTSTHSITSIFTTNIAKRLLTAAVLAAAPMTAMAQSGDRVFVGPDSGTVQPVRLFNPFAPGTPLLGFTPFGPSFSGGVRVGLGDFNRDGVPDMVAGSGPSGAASITVRDGTNGNPLFTFAPFGAFSGGVFVAAGDVNGDGVADVVAGSDAGAGTVQVFDGTAGGATVIHSFFPYGGAFTGGVRVATGDVNGDGFEDIVTGAGAGTGGHVKVFDGRTGAEIRSFFAYVGFTGGVYVAAGDVDGDGASEIITGSGAGGGPHVKVFDGVTTATVTSFFAYDFSFAGGVRVATGDVNGDGRADIITGPGPGTVMPPGASPIGSGEIAAAAFVGVPPIKVFTGAAATELLSFPAYDASFEDGVFVASVGEVADVPPPPTLPVLTTIWTAANEGGDGVPGAGVDPRIVDAATFVKFGTPSVNDDGHRAFLANWAGPEGKGAGIFAGNTEELVVAQGDAAPGTSGLFHTFKDPLFNHVGGVAFIAKIQGAGVTSGDDTGIWANESGLGSALVQKVREGDDAAGVPGGKIKSFKSVALGDHGMAFTAQLLPDIGGVTKDNDFGLWVDGGFGAQLVAREGDVLPAGTIKKIRALLPSGLSRGHGNGVGAREGFAELGVDEDFGVIVMPLEEVVTAVRIQFLDGTQALYHATPAGLTLVTKSGNQATDYDAGVAFTKFGPPGPARNGSFAFLGKAKGPEVTGTNNSSINLVDPFGSIVGLLRSGDAVDGFAGATFKKFKDPISNSWHQALVPATIVGSGIDKSNDDGLWRAYDGGLHELIAREGSVAQGTSDGAGEHAEFGKFKSIALPENGNPVFVAKLKTGPQGAPGPGGTTKANDDGAWATSPAGFPLLIIREGMTYDGKVVQKFGLLASVSGSQAQTRGHNGTGHLLMRVEFTDKSQAIVDVELPTEVLD